MNAQLSPVESKTPAPALKPGPSPEAVVTIHSHTPDVKHGEKNGKAWEIREQDATLETPWMKVPCKISLARNADPLPVGRYAFDLVRSLKVSDFGSIQFARDLKLIPIV